MEHDDVQPHRRLAEARELDTQHGPALGTVSQLGARRFIHHKPVAALGEPKGRRLPRCMVLAPAPTCATLTPRRAADGVTPLPVPTVRHDIDPRRAREAAAERHRGGRPTHWHDHDPARARRRHSEARLGMGDGPFPECLTAAFPEENTKEVPRIGSDVRVRVCLKAAVAIAGRTRRRVSRVRRTRQGQVAGLEPVDDALLANAL